MFYQYTFDDTFPETLNHGKGQIQSSINILCEKYGVEMIKDYINKYVSKLADISAINTKLIDLDPDDNEELYAAAVANVMTATQDYYKYIGTLPEDVRRFFMLIADTTGADGSSLEELGTFMDKEALFDVSPLLTIQAIRPKRYIMQIDAISNQLTSLSEETQIRVGTKSNQPVTTSVTLDMPQHMRIEGGGVLSTYDKSIINGISSLLESGNTAFSIPMLYHAMTGKQNPTVDDQLNEEITGKLEKMRRMILSIDLTEEISAEFLTDEAGNARTIKDVNLEGYLLPLNKLSGVINGKKTEMYQVISHPPLYSYSKMKRQLASAPITLLNAPVNNNATTIPLKTYLLQRIELMKNKKNKIISNNILYDSIYVELGATDTNKTQKMRIRRYATTILEYFIEQEYIASFVEYKEGRSIKGVRIDL